MGGQGGVGVDPAGGHGVLRGFSSRARAAVPWPRGASGYAVTGAGQRLHCSVCRGRRPRTAAETAGEAAWPLAVPSAARCADVRVSKHGGMCRFRSSVYELRRCERFSHSPG